MAKLKDSSKSVKETEETLEKQAQQIQELKATTKKQKTDIERKDTVIASLTSKLKDAELKILDEKNQLELELKSTKVDSFDFRSMLFLRTARSKTFWRTREGL